MSNPKNKLDFFTKVEKMVSISIHKSFIKLILELRITHIYLRLSNREINKRFRKNRRNKRTAR